MLQIILKYPVFDSNDTYLSQFFPQIKVWNIGNFQDAQQLFMDI